MSHCLMGICTEDLKQQTTFQKQENKPLFIYFTQRLLLFIHLNLSTTLDDNTPFINFCTNNIYIIYITNLNVQKSVSTHILFNISPISLVQIASLASPIFANNSSHAARESFVEISLRQITIKQNYFPLKYLFLSLAVPYSLRILFTSINVIILDFYGKMGLKRKIHVL